MGNFDQAVKDRARLEEMGMEVDVLTDECRQARLIVERFTAQAMKAIARMERNARETRRAVDTAVKVVTPPPPTEPAMGRILRLPREAA